MNPFEHHGIGHLSPSSLNLFIASPGIWSLRYLGRQRDSGNVKMWRGSAVEAGYVAYLRSSGIYDVVNHAELSFWRSVEENKAQGPEADEQAKLIAPMLEQCLKWGSTPDLRAAQIKIEHWFPNVLVPVIGYIDLVFDDIDVDLKTTMALPSKPRPDHVRQVSLYRAARERKPGGLLYVTPKKHAYYDVDDAMMGEALVALNDAAQKLSRLLGAFDKAEDIVAALPIDYSDFRAPKATALRTASASDDFTAVEL